jgi:UDP-N-acetylglucosamine 3-dehydrogenase
MGVRLYSMIHIGLIGQGLMARVYARRCFAIPGTEVSAVEGNGKDGIPDGIARHVSGTVYNNTQELCENAPDVVLVCSPPDSHHSTVKTAADRGIDVFCHPPIASTVEEAHAIADIVQRTGIVFVPGHVCRISPEYVTAKERIDDGKIGSVGNARTFRQLSTDHWIASRDRRTDVVCGLALHDIDFLQWICGAVERVFARRAIHNGDAYALITLRFTNAVGHVDARLSKRSGQSSGRFELAGDGLIEYDSEESTPVAVTRTDGDSSTDPFDTMLPKDPHQLLMEHVIDCVEGNAEPIISVEESIKSLRVGLAALESIEQNAPVTIKNI